MVGAVVSALRSVRRGVGRGVARSGVMDMLRFDRWTAGRYWVDDYGYPSREADKPHLARIENGAGHGSGKPTDKIIEEAADL
jgi:prolyl oligopeptidase